MGKAKDLNPLRNKKFKKDIKKAQRPVEALSCKMRAGKAGLDFRHVLSLSTVDMSRH
jgi:hypothetical protein